MLSETLRGKGRERDERATAMEGTAIEVKALACRDLALPLAIFVKPPVYAVVSLGDGSGRSGRRQPQSTPFDRAGGRNPEWDQELRFDLAGEKACLPLFLEFEFVARWGVGGVLGDRVIGEARVPLRGLAEEYTASTGGSGFRSVSYQVRSLDRKPAGDVTFRYRVRSQHQEIESPPPVPAPPVKQSPCSYPPPPPSPAPAEEACVFMQPGAMYYYCCPAPPPPPPSDPYGYPTKGCDLVGCGYVEWWAPPPPAAEPRGFPWKGQELAGNRAPGDPWAAGGGFYPSPMYG